MTKSKLIQFTWLFMMLMFLILLQNITFAADKLKQIQQAIESSGAKWIAGENWVTQLPPEERRKLCGALLDVPQNAEEKLISIPMTDSLPAKLDWRNNNGNWVTPVRDQAQCGSCWAFSALGQVESWWKLYHGNLDSMIDLSEQFLLSCSEGDCEGWAIHYALEFVKDNGIPTEKCFAYQADDEIPCSDACDNWQNQAVTIPGWGFITLDEPNVDQIKNALLRHPISAGFVVYEDFMHYAGGVYEHVWGEVDAGHAIVIVGWNDAEQSWICKNSWGSGWGENGYFRIKWGQCEMDSYLPFIWDNLLVTPSLSISPEKAKLALTIGDSAIQEIVVTNKGTETLEYSTMDYGFKRTNFWPTRFNAWDSLSWWCGDPDIGGYGNAWLLNLDTPVLDLSQSEMPRLTSMGFWVFEDPIRATTPYDGLDGCNVWVSVDGGASFDIATPVSPSYDGQSLKGFAQAGDMGFGIPGWCSTSGGWIPIEFDLSAYKSDSVVIRFAFASDLLRSTVSDPSLLGFFVDDIKVADGDSVIFEDYGNDAFAMHLSSADKEYTTVDWLTIENGGGAVLPGESAIVKAAVNTRSLSPGNYQGVVRFVSNDTTQPYIEVPLAVELRSPAHDIAITEVVLPAESLLVINSTPIGAKIENWGLNIENDIHIFCRIFNEDQLIYSDSVHIAKLLPDESVSVEFEDFLALYAGSLDLVVSVNNPPAADYNAYNNSRHSRIEVTTLVDGFETASGLWDFQGGWARSELSPSFAGIYGAHVNGGSPYVNNMDAIMTCASGFELSGVDNALLKYWTRYITQRGKDICYVEISGDKVEWTKADSLTGPSTRWTQRAVDLTGLIQSGYEKAWVRFHFISDESTTGYGVAIDDVELHPNITTDIESPEHTQIVPRQCALAQNYPNPFNMTTRIQYSVAKAGDVKLAVYNIQGQVVRSLVKSYKSPGDYSIQWDGRDNSDQFVGSGVYMLHLEIVGQYSTTRKLILMK
ncbi:T9SS type A sorting domain-containing protein [candidate division KSB1 bacterium]|nr:T9SS type A sorting domain-containing protein [candidate division KSB1 bacterium]